jgi:hypothetical protein
MKKNENLFYSSESGNAINSNCVIMINHNGITTTLLKGNKPVVWKPSKTDYSRLGYGYGDSGKCDYKKSELAYCNHCFKEVDKEDAIIINDGVCCEECLKLIWSGIV